MPAGVHFKLDTAASRMFRHAFITESTVFYLPMQQWAINEVCPIFDRQAKVALSSPAYQIGHEKYSGSYFSCTCT